MIVICTYAVTIGAPCNGTQCACGSSTVQGNADVQYCSIAYLWPNGTGMISKVKGSVKSTFDPLVSSMDMYTSKHDICFMKAAKVLSKAGADCRYVCMRFSKAR